MARQTPRKPYSRESIAQAKANRARQILAGKGVTREDSDDELGFEDHPWEWIYSEVALKKGVVSQIVGARMGSFQCMLGEAVLLKAEGSGEAWVGLICEFQELEEEGEKTANFMWFSSEREIRNKEKKRNGILPVRCHSSH